MACQNQPAETGYTLAKLKALQESISDGVLTVEYDDRRVTYRSLKEMLQIESKMMRALGQIGTKCGQKGIFGGRRLTPTFDKGLD